MKMNKIGVGIVSICLAIITSTGANAQEFKLAKSTGRLEIIEVNNVSIEGSNGNEIIFSSLSGTHEKDKRAEGLKAINSLGLEDNTGLGLSVTDKGNVIQVYQLKKMDGPKIKIVVPKGVIVSYTHTSPYGSDIHFKNVEGEIEVSTTHNGVHLENVTGPMTLKTVHGEIEADFSTSIKSPVSIISVHGLVDVTLPAAIKANLIMSTSHGEAFVDPAFKIEFDKSDDKWVRFGSGKVAGKINGGGIDIALSSSHGNIYLRKK
jgi:hypothetical protein